MPIIAFDIESTGPDTEKDRIIDISLVTDGQPPKTYRVNPGIPIPARATAIHGITNEAVRTAPQFAQVAKDIQAQIQGATLLGYRSRKFDAVMLDAELKRAGCAGLNANPEIDVHQIWDQLQPRSLEGASKHWLQAEHKAAHSSAADATVALRVWQSMASKHGLSEADSIRLSKPTSEVDRAGRFQRDTDGEILYNFGKHIRTRVRDDLPVLDWMIDKADFPPETKEIARTLRKTGGKP